jgi:hypothetical protein
MTNILNNKLRWDGGHLGEYVGVITHQWSLEGNSYYGITLPDGWMKMSEKMQDRTLGEMECPGGIIYCMAQCARDLFPCIVEEIKGVFGIPRRGIHRITIDGREYIIYYVPISTKGEVVWETPLNRLDAKHPLRKSAKFRREVQRTIAFCDILSLSSTGEHTLLIRPGVDGEYIPISVNESNTSILRGAAYDFSILTKTLFSKWFGEETSISDIVKEMTHYQSGEITFQKRVPVIGTGDGPVDNLAFISADIRNKVNNIIERYDGNYIWYSNFIIDRMSRHLLI